MKVNSKIIIAAAAVSFFSGSVHAQVAGNGGGLIAGGIATAPLPGVVPPPIRIPLPGPTTVIATPAGAGAGAGLGGLGLAAGPLALGLGAIVAVGAISGRGGSTSGTN